MNQISELELKFNSYKNSTHIAKEIIDNQTFEKNSYKVWLF